MCVPARKLQTADGATGRNGLTAPFANPRPASSKDVQHDIAKH